MFFCFFKKFLLFAITLQKKAEAAHRILEGLGPQVELVSWGTGSGAPGRAGVAGEVGREAGGCGGGGSHLLPSAAQAASAEEAGNPPS